MAESKSGPVKPPVIEQTARPGGATPEIKDTKPAAAKPEATKPAVRQEPKPSAPPRASAAEPESAGFAFGAMLTGAVLGLAAAYGLAWAGYWPAGNPIAADPRLAQYDKAFPELRTEVQTSQAELATLTQRVKTLESAPAPTAASGPAADLSGLEAEIAALKAKIAALPAPAAAAPAVDLSAVTTDLAQLHTALTEQGARLGTAEAALNALGTSVSATTEALAKQPADINSVLQLPLVLSGLESAFANGRPYETELAALRAGMPEAKVPTAIANGAIAGLPRDDVIAARFAAVLPDVLAGRPANPDAGWQDGVLDWFRSAIALRPTGAVEGDDPEAVVSRLEAAIGRRDYQAAETLFAKLPDPMLAAAGDVPAMVTAQAEAARFLDGLRQQALSEVAP